MVHRAANPAKSCHDIAGDWVEVNYKTLMDLTGTPSYNSIIRWLRVLSEQTHACPWGFCNDAHPLIVVERLGLNRPNRYRKWQCGEDVLALRPRASQRNCARLPLRGSSALQPESPSQPTLLQQEPISESRVFRNSHDGSSGIADRGFTELPVDQQGANRNSHDGSSRTR
jgi:hypothetical protein